MSHLPKTLDALARLVRYPDRHTAQAAELLYVVLLDELPDAAKDASAFGAFLERHEPWEVEETFTRTFDVNPACALEVGWHLFGEEYARGLFLVRMREELRKHDIPETTELPDHLSHVLSLVAAMATDEATRFVKACVRPAVEKMSAALEAKETPYRHVLGCLASVLRHAVGASKSDAAGSEPFAARPRRLDEDPLRAYPVADVGDGCDSGCGSIQFVPLEVAPPTSDRSTETPVQAKES